MISWIVYYTFIKLYVLDILEKIKMLNVSHKKVAVILGTFGYNYKWHFCVSHCFAYTFSISVWCFISFSRRLRVRAGRRQQRRSVTDKRTELHPLQDLWHQRPHTEHQLGSARTRRWTGLQWHVSVAAVHVLPPPPLSNVFVVGWTRVM